MASTKMLASKTQLLCQSGQVVVMDIHCGVMKQRDARLIMEVDHEETCSASLRMIRFVNSTMLHSNCNDAFSGRFEIENPRGAQNSMGHERLTATFTQ